MYYIHPDQKERTKTKRYLNKFMYKRTPKIIPQSLKDTGLNNV